MQGTNQGRVKRAFKPFTNEYSIFMLAVDLATAAIKKPGLFAAVAGLNPSIENDTAEAAKLV